MRDTKRNTHTSRSPPYEGGNYSTTCQAILNGGGGGRPYYPHCLSRTRYSVYNLQTAERLSISLHAHIHIQRTTTTLRMR